MEYVIFLLCYRFLDQQEHIKTEVSASEHVATSACVAVKQWKSCESGKSRRPLCLQPEKILLFLVERECDTRVSIVSCRFTRLQEYLCLDK